ncbi:Tfp pilus assembly protein FimT/FimU [Planctomycetota bacterium]
MRKGFSIIEMLVVISLIMLISIPLARLSTITIRDIPQSYRIINANTSILNALKYLREDVNAAKSFPKSFDTYTAGEEAILIELADAIICYELKENEIKRCKLSKTNEGAPDDIIGWPCLNAKIKWRLWKKNGAGYAVEIKTYIERKRGRVIEKKMANSHLYFVGAYQEAVK